MLRARGMDKSVSDGAQPSLLPPAAPRQHRLSAPRNTEYSTYYATKAGSKGQPPYLPQQPVYLPQGWERWVMAEQR